ncbi:hypothetical protein LWI29_032155 [Acer saccharum]|uniref:Uncharacterized protein n=1 Tax=Acer saccharum TaxID=4024 RepID=A0AA39RUE6_ACESA|nr:hypothetical protein LWI29_032155 [Acer saccharum]
MRFCGLDLLINHGVSTSLVEKVKVEIQEFFKLPIEEKKKYCQQAGDIEGYGQAFVVSEEQKLDWADKFGFITLPTHLRKPHLLPNLPLPLRDTLEAYSTELRNLATKILNLMVKALRMEPNDMIELFEEGMQIVTNGIYHSIEHRATVNSSKERLSIATFYNPKLEGDMGPAPSLITPETPALFRRISVTDYLKGYFSRELRGKSYVDVMRIQTGSDKSN